MWFQVGGGGSCGGGFRWRDVSSGGGEFRWGRVGSGEGGGVQWGKR